MSRSQVSTNWMCVYSKTQPLHLLRPGFLRRPWDLLVVKPSGNHTGHNRRNTALVQNYWQLFQPLVVITPSKSCVPSGITKKFLLAEINYWLNNTYKAQQSHANWFISGATLYVQKERRCWRWNAANSLTKARERSLHCMLFCESSIWALTCFFHVQHIWQYSNERTFWWWLHSALHVWEEAPLLMCKAVKPLSKRSCAAMLTRKGGPKRMIKSELYFFLFTDFVKYYTF